MKKILLLLLISVPALAQDGFKTVDGKVVWERIFSSSTDVNALIAANEKLEILASQDNIYKGVGEGVKQTSPSGSLRMNCETSFEFTITVAPEGYLVRVTDFMFLEKYGPMQMRTVPNSLEKYYTEYGKIRDSAKTQTDLGFVDTFLTGVFSNQPVQEPESITYN
jgi:hypothetical protein